MRISDRIELSAKGGGIGPHNLQASGSGAATRRSGAGDDTREKNRAERDNYTPHAPWPSNAFIAR
jgi:hypothetical protein